MVWGEEGVASGRRRFEWGRGLNGGCGQWGGWLERGRGFGEGGVAARRCCVGRGRGVGRWAWPKGVGSNKGGVASGKGGVATGRAAKQGPNFSSNCPIF